MEEMYPDSTAGGKYMKRTKKLMKVLLNSGDGLSPETAYRALFFYDERFVLSVLELGGYSKQALLNINGNSYDELTVKKSKQFRKKKIYFDVSTLFAGMSRSFK